MKPATPAEVDKIEAALQFFEAEWQEWLEATLEKPGWRQPEVPHFTAKQVAALVARIRQLERRDESYA